MTNVMFMQVGNSWKDLSHDASGLGLWEEFLFDNEIKELSAFTNFCDKVEGFLGFIDFVEFDDVGMVEFFQYLHFRGEHLFIGDVFFGDGFDGTFLTWDNKKNTCDFMLGKEDNSVASRTKLSYVLVVIFDVFGFGGGDEELFFDFDSFCLNGLHLVGNIICSDIYDPDLYVKIT